MIVVDASGAVAGRLGAFVAKQLLKGEQVIIVNAEKAVISGNKVYTVNVYRKRRHMTNKANPEKAAKWPRRPDLLLKKIVSGMLPPKTATKKKSLHALMVYMGKPDDVKEEAKQYVKTASSLGSTYITIGELCSELGWNSKVKE